jgi:hypothetical protein
MRIETIDIEKHDITIVFFLPSFVSARVERRNEPKRQPMKKEDCGKPVTKLLAH